MVNLGDVREDGAVYSDKYDGRPRWMIYSECRECGSRFLHPPHRTRKYCSKKCSELARRDRLVVSCLNCGIEFERTESKVGELNFCSRECKDNAQRVEVGLIAPSHYKGGAYAYRKKALLYYGPTCNRCSFEEDERLLDVHHIDGDRKNNVIENLEVLCVMCHARETRKAISNMGG